MGFGLAPALRAGHLPGGRGNGPVLGDEAKQASALRDLWVPELGPLFGSQRERRRLAGRRPCGPGFGRSMGFGLTPALRAGPLPGGRGNGPVLANQASALRDPLGA